MTPAACLLCGAATDGALQCERCINAEREERDRQALQRRSVHRLLDSPPPKPPMPDAAQMMRLVDDYILDGRAREADRAFVLPLPPSLNASYRAVGGRVLLSSAARKWKKAAALELEAQRPGHYVAGYVALDIDVYYARRRNDLDNATKLLLDVLKGRVMDDDSMVQQIVLRKHIDTANPRVEVRVRAYTEEQEAA